MSVRHLAQWRYGLAGAVLPMLICAEDAWAAGGAHVVDDAEVETPGRCHAESWATWFGDERRLINVSPACTPTGIPTLEIGGTIQSVRHEGRTQTTIGPALKLALRPVERGVGLGVAVSANVDVQTGDVRSAGLLVPLTADLSPSVRLNVNLGYQWADSGDRHAGFAGVQVDVKATNRLSAMAEVFVRDSHRAGFQAGLRWTPADAIDVDLLAGQRIDGTRGNAITLGMTIRG